MRQIKAHVAAEKDASSVTMEHSCFTVNQEHLAWAFSVCLAVNILVLNHPHPFNIASVLVTNLSVFM